MSSAGLIVLQFAVLAYALVGGAFLAFSDFIMRSLAHTGGARGVEAMQVINREVFRWVFMTLFLGMALTSIILIGYAAFHLDQPAMPLIGLTGLIYVIGCFGVTVVFNVPMNEALAKMDLSADSTQQYWTKIYLPRWTRWNTVRAIACTVSAGTLLWALIAMAQVPPL